jgi:hypothetical protein
MMTQRSDAAYSFWRESSERFDYFVTGLTGALVAYVGQTIQAHRIGTSPESVELLALVVLVASVMLGFKRIETNVEIFKLMHKRLYNEESRGNLLSTFQGKPVINKSTGDVMGPAEVLQQAQEHQLHVEAIEEVTNKLIKESGQLYAWRNRTLVAGFALLVGSRILPAYLP